MLSNGMTPEVLMKTLNAEDVQRTLQAKAGNVTSGTRASQQFVKKIDAVSANLPHTNEAAKRARGLAYAHHHNLGAPNIFVTGQKDDDNCYLMQVYSGITIDNDTPVEELSDDELQKRAKERTELRLNYPGLSAYMFECLMEIIMEEVIGWDMKNRKSTGKGLFGECYGALFAIEEQGRKTLHAHILAWIKNLTKLMKKLEENDVNRTDSRQVEEEIAELYDEVASTELIPICNNINKLKLKKALDHKCKGQPQMKKRKLPDVVELQQLRNLRHIDCKKSVQGLLFASCPHCISSEGQFTNERLVESYLKHGIEVPKLSHYPDRATRRLEAMTVEYQKPQSRKMDPAIIHAAYNNHRSSSTTSGTIKNTQKKKSSPQVVNGHSQ